MGGLARHVIHVIIHGIKTVSKQKERFAKQRINKDLTRDMTVFIYQQCEIKET